MGTITRIRVRAHESVNAVAVLVQAPLHAIHICQLAAMTTEPCRCVTAMAKRIVWWHSIRDSDAWQRIANMTDAPLLPDPYDPTIPKRTWEVHCQHTRREILRLNELRCESDA